MSNDAPMCSPPLYAAKCGAAQCTAKMPHGLDVSRAAVVAAVVELEAEGMTCQSLNTSLDLLTSMLGVDMRPRKPKLAREIASCVQSLLDQNSLRRGALEHSTAKTKRGKRKRAEAKVEADASTASASTADPPKDPFGARARSRLDPGARPPCVVCGRTLLPAERMSFCGNCHGFACDDGFARHCGSYFAPKREEYRQLLHGPLGDSREEADAFYQQDLAAYRRACDARAEFPDDDRGLFTCYPCWKMWREGE